MNSSLPGGETHTVRFKVTLFHVKGKVMQAKALTEIHLKPCRNKIKH